MLTERDRACEPSLGMNRFLEGGAIGASVPFLSIEGFKPDAASSPKAMGVGLFLSILFHAALIAVILRASIMPMGMDGSENRIDIELISPPCLSGAGLVAFAAAGFVMLADFALEIDVSGVGEDVVILARR